MQQLFVLSLEHLGVLRIRGADARRFLQGQVSNDIGKLKDGPLFAGLHDPQGRVLALLRMVALGDDDVLALLPRELSARILAHLQKYVLRARVTLEAADAQWHAYGICGPDTEAAAHLRKSIHISSDPPRAIVVAPRHEALPEGDHLEPGEWDALDIADGLPEVYSATSGEFLAQMLNLDLLDGISFGKGCYTGQEIIARAHWRGRVKRRMQRFATEEQRALSPGERITLADGRRVQVVRQARYGQVGSEFLAVAAIDASEEAPGEPAEGESRLVATRLALPYDLD